MGWNCYSNVRGKAVEAITADGEPASAIKQVAGIVADVGEFKSGDRAVVGGLEDPLVFEGKGRRGVFGKSCGKGNADRGILGDALGGERLVLRVQHTGDA